MRSQYFRVSWGGFFILIFFTVGCTLNVGLKEPKGEGDFLLETLRLEKLSGEDPAPSVRAKSHLQLAFLYVNSRNPQLNYSRALLEMESYLSMSPVKVQQDDFQNWFSVLKELDRVRKDKKKMEEKNQDLQTRIGEMRISMQKVQDANKGLRDRVANLQGVIEKLKNLDYQMEEKRDRIK